MNKKINNIKLYIKSSKKAREIAELLKKELLNNYFNIVDSKYDLAISIGGDGTFLKMIHENKFNNNIFYSGINAGSLGYLTEFEKDEIKDFVKMLSNNTYSLKNLSYIKAIVYGNNENVEHFSLNEFIIKKQNQLLLKTDICINNELLEKYVGDGILLSTSNGSTAYNLSFNGPIMDLDLDALILTPIAPINNKIFRSIAKSIILNNDKKINIILKENDNMSFISDGKVINANNINKIEIVLNNKKLKIITINENNFAKKIYSKII